MVTKRNNSKTKVLVTVDGAVSSARGSYRKRVDKVLALSHEFRDPVLRQVALTHGSVTDKPSYDRLEFLGDAVLSLIVADELMVMHPTADEGDLTRWRSALTNRAVMAEIASEYRLDQLIKVGPGTSPELPSIMSCAMEALVGAVYLDGGMSAARRFVRSAWDTRFRTVQDDVSDYKTELQEYTQKRWRVLPEYDVKSVGKQHAPLFEAKVYIDESLYATGIGPSRKSAEALAARGALEKLTHR